MIQNIISQFRKSPPENPRGETSSSMADQSREEVQQLCLESIKDLKVGIGQEEQQNGKDFYKYFFGNYPQLRVYFKGAENYTPADVQKSERFEKQGQRLLLAMHLCANIFANKMVFEMFVREQVNRHRQFKLDPALWTAFWTVWTGFLESKGKLSEKHKDAWFQLGKQFAQVANHQLELLGLPFVKN